MPSATSPASVRVSLAERSYDVLVGAGLLDTLGERLSLLFGRARRAFLVYDAGLADSIVIAASRSLAHHGFTVAAASVQAEESQKTLGTVARLLVDLAETRHERADPVIALGGGVTGDIAGFIAASYRRGTPFVQCPTTLLSMVDASVGGKTGVNLLAPSGLLKNMVGAFWQPSVVFADPATLATLPERHFRSGLAECVKHGMLGGLCADPGLFDTTVQAMDRVLARDVSTLAELVRRNVALKARFVESDERETVQTETPTAPPGDRPTPRPAGGRALLNLGHTFGHAIETIPDISPDGSPANAPLQHGEAVALGLLAACACGEAMGLTRPDVRPALWAALGAAGLPRNVRGLPDSARITETMTHDKKAAGGRLRLVLPTTMGHAVVVTDPPAAAVIAGIDSIRA